MSENKKKRKILLVDDEEHLLVTLRDFLTFEGFDVYMAKSGEEALERLRKLTPDLIILDISMPGIGGLGFLRKTSSDGQRPPCPVLVLTARSNMREFFDDMDVAGFLAKPCTKEELLGTMKRILAKHSSHKSEGVPRTKVRILLAEDDVHLAGSLCQRFEGAGYAVSVADNGPRVLETAPREQPDIVVLKGILTRMNGDAVASLLRAMPSTKDVPIVLYDPDRKNQVGRRLPAAVDRLVPSADATDLLEAVEEILTSWPKGRTKA